MKSRFFVLIAILICCAHADAQPDSLWSRTFGGGSYDYCHSVQQTTDGGYILGGETGSFGEGSTDLWLVKTDANGDSLWSRTFGGGTSDYCTSVQQTTDGGYILGGGTTSYGAGETDLWLVRTDANGDSLWSRTFGGSSNDLCLSVEQTTDGGYILGGGTTSYGAGNNDFWLVKTNANGDSLWSRTYGGSEWDICYSAQQTSDGGYVLAGYTYSFSAGESDFWLVKTDANGDSLWSRTFGGSSYDLCLSVEQTTDGGYVLGGYTSSYGAGDDDFWLVKTDTNGDSLWSRTFGGGNDDLCRSVQQTADGGYILGGETESFGPGFSDFWLVKTDANGDSLWSRTFGGSDYDDCYSVEQTADDGYILGGHTHSYGAGSWDFWLLRTTPESFPPGPFTRLLPEDDSVLVLSGPIDFIWTQSHDPNGDEVSYIFQVEYPSFDGFVEPSYAVITDTMITVEVSIPLDNLDETYEFYWTVHATANGDTVEASNGEGLFYVDIPEPPGPFERVLPEDSSMIVEPNVQFVWTSSIDPNGDDVSYLIHVESPTYPFPDPADYTTTDTSITVEIPWPTEPLDDIHEFFWTVHATAEGDTIEASNGEGLFYMDITGAANEASTMPTEYSLSAYPNPFNSELTLTVTGFTRDVRISLHNPLGQEVDVIHEGALPGSRLHYSAPALLSSGLYFIRAADARHVRTGKVVFLK